ncbi:MAG TPA: uracil-DNA glycosylase [Candidatus Absconditabacterales bacterium]|nr:uracil-DNA glycosylase [Candidatus Absconditabacterales bacterium]HNG97065.1 uracil-DNA glycosylase [Candidatus Absconditabacterales bacterium]
MTKKVQIDDSRYTVLQDEFDKPYFSTGIIPFIHEAKNQGKTIYPSNLNIFKAFELTHREDVQVVILGQDPYHGPGQAHGLCFSVPPGMTPPPSLVNIFKEIQSEYPDQSIDLTNGDLTSRAKQGALLLNAFLTVEAGKPLSHSVIGREQFTDTIIHTLSQSKTGLVFMLWGTFAKSKQTLIDKQKHIILTASHPSPLSANRGGWFGNNHFRLCNEYLSKQGKKNIQWTRIS